jgi:hypothetical protein
MAGSVAPIVPDEPAAPDAAINAARSRLGEARRRFIDGDLPPFGHLLVRQQLEVPGGAETIWVRVASWRDASSIRGRSLNDGVHPALAHIRMGRPVVVDVSTVIDWAVVSDDGAILEGARTQRPR